MSLLNSQKDPKLPGLVTKETADKIIVSEQALGEDDEEQKQDFNNPSQPAEKQRLSKKQR